MPKSRLIKIMLTCCKLLLLAIVIGAVLIAAANYFPINTENKQRSLEQLAEEGYFPEVPSTSGGYGDFQSKNPTALELATDNLMVKMALYDGEDSGIVQAFRCYSTQLMVEYSRYWHGYVVVLRILLFFFQYYEIRIINGIFQIMLFCAIMGWLVKHKGTKYAIAFATSYALLMPAALAQCLQYSWIYYIAFTALFIYIKRKEYLEKEERYIYFFLLLGAVTSYLDLLTYPLFTWGLVIVWWLLLQDKVESVGRYLLKVIFSAVSWVIGYAVMWMGKWVVGSLVLRENLFQKAISEAMLWTVDGTESVITWRDRFHALFLNWETYSYKLYFIVLAAWLIYAVIRSFFGVVKDARIPALLLIGCSSSVWYMVLAGHTIMHHIFTHRIFGVSIAAFLGIILLSTRDKAVLLPVKNILYRCIAFGLAGILSLFLLFQLRSDYAVYNYHGISFDKVPADGVISMSLTPAFSQIDALGIGVSVEDGIEGEYRISLWDQDEIIYEDTVLVSEWANGNYQELSVDWELEAGKTYTFQVEQYDTDGTTYLWVTADGIRPLAELGGANIRDKAFEGQMLMEITYWCRPVGKYNCLFWTISLMCVCVAVMAACWNGWSLLYTNKKNCAKLDV